MLDAGTQALAARAAGESLWGETRVVPCCTQMVSAAPTTHHRAQLSLPAKVVVPQGKIFKKGLIMPDRETRREQKEWANSEKEEGNRWFRGWNRNSPAVCGEDHGEADCPLAAHGGLHAGTGGYILRELWLVETPCWSRGEVWERRSSREEPLSTDHIFPQPLTPLKSQ